MSENARLMCVGPARPALTCADLLGTAWSADCPWRQDAHPIWYTPYL